MNSACFRPALLTLCAWAMASGATGVFAAHPGGPQPAPPGGKGTLYSDVCLKGTAAVPEVCGTVEVAWKLWTALDEPMGDFDLLWKPATVRISDATGGASLLYNVDALPATIGKAMQRIRLRVEAVAFLQNPSFNRGSVAIAFHTGQPTHPGETSTSAPHGYEWAKLLHNGMSPAAPTAEPVAWCMENGRRSLAEADARAIVRAGVRLENLRLCPGSTLDVLPVELAIARICGSAFTGTALGTSPHFCAKKEFRKSTVRRDSAIDAAFDRLEGRSTNDSSR